MRGSIRNTTRQLLHIASELSSLLISKTCLQELGIISDNFPLPEKVQDSVDAVGEPSSSALLSFLSQRRIFHSYRNC